MEARNSIYTFIAALLFIWLRLDEGDCPALEIERRMIEQCSGSLHITGYSECLVFVFNPGIPRADPVLDEVYGDERNVNADPSAAKPL